MPKTYSISRKINLGKYGLQYEAMDITVEGAASFGEAAAEIKAMKDEIHQSFAREAAARKQELDNKAKLTFSEEEERKNIAKLDRQSELPF